ncbi:hypothetical protein V9T40_014200 [Parthenolecanium corni]|uniref:Methanethiol oxidase n=1 Tax=Parthenolecanium corni TaxID=536013 RepID=A0AAN9TQH7_9HEMI
MATQTGPGYKTPLDAFRYGAREKILYVICINPEPKKRPTPDYLAVIDVDPSSSTYSQVINRTYMKYVGDELHHFGWNSCSSCYDDPTKKRNKIIIPAIGSDRIYILNVDDLKAPVIEKVIEPEEVRKHGITTMHTTHCSPNGEILISSMGDNDANGKGEFLVIDEHSMKIKGTWTNGERAKFGYDFWYQPYYDVMISSEWGAPSSFKCGFCPEHVDKAELYGRSLNVFSWSKRKLIQTIDLGPEGTTPLEIRFLHNPKADQGFVGCGLHANIYRFFRKSDETWDAEKVISVPHKKVEGYNSPEISGMITDILISMDDKYLYFNNWLHGDVRQYDITNPSKPKLVGQLFLGGKLLKDGPIKIIEDPDNKGLQNPVFVKGRRLLGGPQMMQLSLDGKRLYMSTALYSPWDHQFYPETVTAGSTLVKIDVNTEIGGLTLDPDFLIDFGKEPEGPYFAHEIRYPGGDCTSDIYLPEPDSCCCSRK